MLLAARGACVVVNDLGGSIEGEGGDAEVAARVAAEIEHMGGDAIADDSDVAAPAGARSLVDRAQERYGRLDILVNNAGIMRWGGMPELDAGSIAKHLDVHIVGSFNTTRAAWPYMAAQNYGRIVMTTSSGVFGLPNNTAYAVAKGGVIGLVRSLATASAANGIMVNAIAPAAATRMGGDVDAPQMSPELVAPMVAYLAHEDCPVNGEIYAAGFGRFARLFVAETRGFVETARAPTVEDVAAHWATINDEAGYSVPRDLVDWSKAFMAHLRS
jgi:NAD(P)-dependent dehydrogenase (short-subunit alcohol dehydrogenase family)